MKKFYFIFMSSSKIAMLLKTNCREYEFLGTYDMYSMYAKSHNTRYYESIKAITRLIYRCAGGNITCLHKYDDLSPQQIKILEFLYNMLTPHGITIDIVEGD